jgi:hypothetical protein
VISWDLGLAYACKEMASSTIIAAFIISMFFLIATNLSLALLQNACNCIALVFGLKNNSFLLLKVNSNIPGQWYKHFPVFY